MKPRLYADFQNLDDENRVRLDTVGTRQDLSRLGIQLKDGLAVVLYTDDGDELGRPDDLEVEGVVRRAPGDEWVAQVDWDTIRHTSDNRQLSESNGSPTAPDHNRSAI